MRLSRVFRSRKAIPFAVMAVAASAALPAVASANNQVDITPFQAGKVVVNTAAGANQNTALTQITKAAAAGLGPAIGSAPLQLVAQVPNAADGTTGDFYCLDTGANPLGLANLPSPANFIDLGTFTVNNGLAGSNPVGSVNALSLLDASGVGQLFGLNLGLPIVTPILGLAGFANPLSSGLLNGPTFGLGNAFAGISQPCNLVFGPTLADILARGASFDVLTTLPKTFFADNVYVPQSTSNALSLQNRINDYAADISGPKGEFGFRSAATGGIVDSASFTGSNFTQKLLGVANGVASLGYGRSQYANTDALFLGFLSPLGDPILRVADGAGASPTQGDVALLPGNQHNHLDGAKSIVLSHATGLAAGSSPTDASVTETDQLMACEDVTDVDQSNGECDRYDLNKIPVTLTRKSLETNNGQQAIITDTFKNTDQNRAKTITVRYQNEWGGVSLGGLGNLGIPAFAVGDSTPQQANGGDVIVPSSSAGPFSLIVEGQRLLNDSSAAVDDGAMTYQTAPDRIQWLNQSHTEAIYTRTIQPGQSVSLTQTLSQAGGLSEARALAATAEGKVSSAASSVVPTVQQVVQNITQVFQLGNAPVIGNPATLASVSKPVVKTAAKKKVVKKKAKKHAKKHKASKKHKKSSKKH